MDKGIFKNIIRVFIGAAVILSVWWIVKCQCISLEDFTPAAIRDYIQGFGRFAVIVHIIAYTLNTISIVPPIAGLSLAAGLVFGKIWGAVYLMIGAMLGTSCTFFISRFFGRQIAERFLKGKFKNLDNSLERRGFGTILFFRLIPIVPYEVLNYASGLSKIRFKDYFLATLVGLIPGVTISAFFGGTLGEVEGVKDIFSGKFLIAVVALLMIILVPVLYKYLKKKNRP